MWNNPNPDNKPVSPEEKDKRSFTVALVFIVVIGFSIIAFIFKFRQAKREASQFQRKRQEREQTPGLQYPSQQSNSSASGREKASNKKEKASNGVTSRLVPAKRDRPTKKDSLPTLYHMKQKVDFLGEYISHKGQSYLEVENIKAFPSNMKDRFSEEEIVGLKNDRVYAFVKKGENLDEALGVAYNSRTKKIGLITGTLKIRFTDDDSFQERVNWIRAPFFEKRSFDAIKLSLIEAQSTSSATVALGQLQEELKYWSARQGVKSVEIEILENEIKVK